MVNFTPVLIEQIEDLDRSVRANLQDGAPLPDALLATLSSAPLPADAAGRLALLRACLRADRENLIGRFPPLARLADLATAVNTPEQVQYVSDQMLYDLSVWYHIAWMGESVRREDPRIAALVAKERGFDAADRLSLLQLIGELLAGVLPRFRKLSESGRCELAVSPYSHPILPLLLDFATAQEGEPAAPAPRHAQYPGGEERVPGTCSRPCSSTNACSVARRAAAGHRRARSANRPSAPSRRRGSTGWPPASPCCGHRWPCRTCRCPRTTSPRSGSSTAPSGFRAATCTASSATMPSPT